MNTKKFFYGLMALVVLVGAGACTQDSADNALYEQGVDRSTIINGDAKNSVDRSTIINGDAKKSVDRSTIINGDARK